jgi:hypothetical protein
VCGFSYTACNGHGLYYHLWPTPFYSIFPHYLINGKIFGKKIYRTQNVYLISSATYVWNITHSKKNWASYDHNYLAVFLYSTCYSCTVPAILVQLLLFLYSTCFREQYLLFLYSTCYSWTIPAVLVQYLLFLYSTYYSWTVPAILVQ